VLGLRCASPHPAIFLFSIPAHPSPCTPFGLLSTVVGEWGELEGKELWVARSFLSCVIMVSVSGWLIQEIIQVRKALRGSLGHSSSLEHHCLLALGKFWLEGKAWFSGLSVSLLGCGRNVGILYSLRDLLSYHIWGPQNS
jgi:hypothetical protein